MSLSSFGGRTRLALPLLAAAALSACGGATVGATRPAAPSSSEGSGPEPDTATGPASPPDPGADPDAAVDSAPRRSESAPLSRFFATLDAIEGGAEGVHARILQIGDSHTASDTFTGPLRAELSRHFGSGGRGYLYAGRPWDGYRQQHADYDAGGEWSGTLGVRRRWSPPLGMGGARNDATAAGAWFERGSCDGCGIGEADTRVRIFYAQAPDAGRFEVTTSSGARSELDASGEPGLGIASVEAAGPTAWVRVEVIEPPVSFFGTSTESTESGVIVDSLGMNGGRADQWTRFGEEPSRDELAALAPDLVVVAFGTNEAFGDTYRLEIDEDPTRRDERLRAYGEAFDALLDRYTLAGTGAECLILLPPDFHDGDTAVVGRIEIAGEAIDAQLPPESRAAIAAVQEQIAASRGCAVWDMQAAMGGPGAMSAWQTLSPALGSGDAVHLTTRGYARLAEALASDLIAAYVDWLAGGPGELRTQEADEGVGAPLRVLQ